jgi:hypothetical protein
MIGFPKPKKPSKPTVRVFRDGREVCNLLVKAGKDEYNRRMRVMWERQKRRCCLEGIIEGCTGYLKWEEATFEHQNGRGHGGGSRDDRIEIDGKPVNGVAHPRCNIAKGSRRIDYLDVP